MSEVTLSACGRFDSAPSAELLAFQRLDSLLAPAVSAARVRFGADAPADSFRGLYVTAEQAEEGLARPMGEPLVSKHPVLPGWERIAAGGSRWDWLRTTCGLDDLEMSVVLVALGPEADLRYERIYGYLQDDVTRRHATVDLALDLLTRTADERLAARRVFAHNASLRARRVLSLRADPRVVAQPLLAQQIVLDEQIVDILLGGDGIDGRVTGCTSLLQPQIDRHSTEQPDRALLDSVTAAHSTSRDLRLYLQGNSDAGRLRMATALAAAQDIPLLTVDLERLPLDSDDAALAWEVILRIESWHRALLYVCGVDALWSDERAPVRRELERRLVSHRGVVLLGGSQDWKPLGLVPLGVLSIACRGLGVRARREAWQHTLSAQGANADPDDLNALAGRFRINAGQIEEAALTAIAAARCRLASGPHRAELFAAARAQSGHELAALTRKIEPIYGWADIVLPADPLAQLRELCDRVTHRDQVMGEWGFDATLSQGKGISALFTGPPGTGKTMAAEVLARELGLDLYKINLAAVVSKYIGETEKNLERVFTAAAGADAILLFDEADALFGKRSDVRDAHDRYANIEVAYLLQRMEQYDGLAILATNVRQHLDEAFTRRLQFIVDFPFPDVAERRRIWQVCFPPAAPRDPGIDLDRLAGEFRLAGGNIRNIVLAAAFRAAAEGTPITMGHLLAATAREHQKLGRIVSPATLGVDPHQG